MSGGARGGRPVVGRGEGGGRGGRWRGPAPASADKDPRRRIPRKIDFFPFYVGFFSVSQKLTGNSYVESDRIMS